MEHKKRYDKTLENGDIREKYITGVVTRRSKHRGKRCHRFSPVLGGNPLRLRPTPTTSPPIRGEGLPLDSEGRHQEDNKSTLGYLFHIGKELFDVQQII